MIYEFGIAALFRSRANSDDRNHLRTFERSIDRRALRLLRFADSLRYRCKKDRPDYLGRLAETMMHKNIVRQYK